MPRLITDSEMDSPLSDSSEPIVTYPVSIWECMAIAAGALLLGLAGLAGLGLKFVNNAFDPVRAEAIAQSLMDYQIPGGAKGIFGANLGGAKVSLINSLTTVQVIPQSNGIPAIVLPEVELFIARLPMDRTGSEQIQDPLSISGISFTYEPEGEFNAEQSIVQPRSLCGISAPLTLQQGYLSWGDSDFLIPATQYSASIVLNEQQHLITLSAIGQNAEANANAVFESLRCK